MDSDIQIALQEAKRNLETPQGGEFRDSVSAYVASQYSGLLKSCRDSLKGSDTTTTVLLVKLNRRGYAKGILLERASAAGGCALEKLRPALFLPPPGPNYWVRIEVKPPRK